MTSNVTVHVRPGMQATIICPSCNKAKSISVASLHGKQHTIKVRCSCNNPFIAHLNFRKHYRKEINLTGSYHVLKPPGSGGGVIQIQNISMTGIGFTVSGHHNMKEKQTVQLEFHLDDRNKTKMLKLATIRSVQDNYIGCAFADQKLYEKELGFYLRF